VRTTERGPVRFRPWAPFQLNKVDTSGFPAQCLEGIAIERSQGGQIRVSQSTSSNTSITALRFRPESLWYMIVR
jgi:hypothetical protein